MILDTNPKSTKKSDDLEITEIKTIKGKLSEIHNDIIKLMESSNRLRSEAALENSRQEYLHSFLNYLFDDLETGAVLSEILVPISNKQRLDILKAVAFEPRSFSALSKLTTLIAGHLHFHLQKLLDCNLILQQHERGDYMITEKGFKILKSLNEMYSSLQYVPP